ncbi:MAG: DUF4105 domain-containing protein [Chitinophagaceae bacterium]|nr:DUF4105 domain-containing protein [Oligoflexus sp.]
MPWLFFLVGILSELFSLRLAYAQGRPYEDAQWLRLIHYRTGWTTPHVSSIETPDFFFDPTGRINPDAEWSANLRTLKAKEIFFRGATADPQCLYPARALYFRRLGLLSEKPRSCAEFEAFQRSLNIESMSLVFSTAFAGNSASMFGHVLLKLNRSDSEQSHGLLDHGVAFLALSNPADGALYAVRGMFGGYPGFYNVQPYYELVNQYAYNENRDLWELKIPLSKAEREMLAAHLWEVNHGASASYYFAHVNCAAMLGELIDVVKPAWAIRESIHGFVMPTELMRSVAVRAELPVYPEIGLRFRPSQKRRWLAKMQRLNAQEISAVNNAWAAKSLNGIPPDVEVYDTLLDRITLEKGSLRLAEQGAVRTFEQEVLRARSELPSRTEADLTASNNPLTAHAPRVLGINSGALDGHPRFGLHLKAGWHDLLDNPQGFEPYYQLNFLDLTLHRYADKAKLSDLNLRVAEVWSLNPWHSDDHQLSWTMAGGAEYAGGQHSLYFRASYGISGGFDRFLISVLPGAELREIFSPDHLELKGFFRIQGLARWTDTMRTLVWGEPSADDEGHKRVNWALESRWDASRDYQFQAKWDRREEHTESTGWELGVSHTF